ncbi:CoxG family protein [Cupriavidus pinatubonensis]|uniref:Carbon monoxide dehydrogenase subunit G n=1 Tax=Cupriavidus pinatubonensis TaxID=248026 RepID=A0ABM8Y4E9_9BURK|nr:carbon monoxide dehydrogenase subunit G [Cupriavidus pinatubonensis]CAG9187621.1 hypothetical protein LMG23994_07066 [Cupriavidus pinatubonensis]
MELVGEQLINAPRTRVWDAINDPKILSGCIPGCEELIKVSPTESTARVMLKIGPVRARFSGRILMADLVAPASCRMSFEGAGGAAGFAKGASEVSLVEEGDKTRLRYTVAASVGGKLGQIGGRLIDASAKKVADEFFTALDAALTSGPSQSTPNLERGIQAEATSVPLSATPTAAAQPASQAHVGTATIIASGFTLSGELTRAFWFCLGVGTTLLAMHFAR